MSFLDLFVFKIGNLVQMFNKEVIYAYYVVINIFVINNKYVRFCNNHL